MAESQSLRLALLLSGAYQRLLECVADELSAIAHRPVSAPVLNFLSQLDCGINHASEVARHLGVSRQMVAKTVADLEQAGWLETAPDPERRNRRVIRFTEEGERLMADARAILVRLDSRLDSRLGSGWSEPLNGSLEELIRALPEPRSRNGPAAAHPPAGQPG